MQTGKEGGLGKIKQGCIIPAEAQLMLEKVPQLQSFRENIDHGLTTVHWEL